MKKVNVIIPVPTLIQMKVYLRDIDGDVTEGLVSCWSMIERLGKCEIVSITTKPDAHGVVYEYKRM